MKLESASQGRLQATSLPHPQRGNKGAAGKIFWKSLDIRRLFNYYRRNQLKTGLILE
jgi:hypothetical protein